MPWWLWGCSMRLYPAGIPSTGTISSGRFLSSIIGLIKTGNLICKRRRFLNIPAGTVPSRLLRHRYSPVYSVIIFLFMMMQIKNISGWSEILHLFCRLPRRLPSAGFTGEFISGSVWIRALKPERRWEHMC